MAKETLTTTNLPFVIGAGLGRTGTHSLQAALMSLGYNKPFHMKEILDGYTPPDKWFELAANERSTGVQNKTLALEVAQSIIDLGYTATTDYPACLLYQELMELQPNGKVILSVRNSAKEWKRSVSETIGIINIPLMHPPFSFVPFFQGFAGTLDPWLWERTANEKIAKFGQIDKYSGQSVMDYEENLEYAYEQWIKQVKKTVPANKLLIHQYSDGYSPICKHLGIPDSVCPPDSEYPHIGDTAELKQLIKVFTIITQIFWPIVGLIILGLVWFIKKKITVRVVKSSGGGGNNNKAKTN